ncbi:blast:Transcription initiation factor TFIID subunit 8 [Drosophila guanche]|uniref:Transcription initiation factor TFIID subunit 8 n=1 Tax=Drosophila guanche TaxID=7266 RepID=A0A3B0K387_DROGU|nr:blast:Transcription initiation factor TFIID subunit 8 [Drosophila guanche]
MDKIESVSTPNVDVYRRLLVKVICQLLLDKGANQCSAQCLETLTEMLQACRFIVELGNSSHNYCELSGRTMATVGDVSMALIGMGQNIGSLETYLRREPHAPVQMPPQQTQQRTLSLLQAGTKASHPPYVPSYFPPMPDPHAYIRTPTHKQPVTEYEAIREKAACQKRDIEKALTKFLCKTTETNNLFPTEDNMFPLIACNPSLPPYYAALNPTDQDGDEGDSDNEDIEGDKSKEDKQELEIKPNSTTNKAILENPNIDNPYLRAATLPKRTKLTASPATVPPPRSLSRGPSTLAITKTAS